MEIVQIVLIVIFGILGLIILMLVCVACFCPWGPAHPLPAPIFRDPFAVLVGPPEELKKHTVNVYIGTRAQPEGENMRAEGEPAGDNMSALV